MTPRRLLTVGHSYAVALNRRLAAAVAHESGGRWAVTVAGPAAIRGDLRPVRFEPDSEADPGYAARPVPAYLTGRPPLMSYGRQTRALLAGGWDAVHVWEEPYVVSGWQLLRWTPAGVPACFYTFQNLAKRYPPPFAWMERDAVGRAAGWIAAGRTVEETLLGRPGYAARPHRVLPLGVDTDRFRPDPAAGAAVRRRLGWDPGGPPVVGFLGRFVPEKGLDRLTRALDAAAPGSWRALFVGGGPLEGWLRGWAAGHGDRARVVTGVPHPEVPPHLAAMDLLVAPSQTTPRWREQFGRMLVEGFACRLAVVGSDSGEIPHVIGDAGRVVPEADDAGWAAAVADLLDSPGRRAELAARGFDRAHARFAWPVVGRAHVAFFDELADGRAGRP